MSHSDIEFFEMWFAGMAAIILAVFLATILRLTVHRLRLRVRRKRMKKLTPVQQQKIYECDTIDAAALFPLYFGGNRKAVAAEDRAAQLLWNHMDATQRKDAITTRTFRVNGSRGRWIQLFTDDVNRTFVKPIIGREMTFPACIHEIRSSMSPLGDVLLNKKIQFEADPTAFLKIANY